MAYQANFPLSEASMTHDQLVDQMIADCDGDPRATISALLKIIHHLTSELHALTGKRSYERASKILT